MGQQKLLSSGRILVNGSEFYCGNSTNGLCKLALSSEIPSVTPYVHPTTKQCNYVYTHPSEIQCNAASEINSLKTSVSSGKSQIASAITDKGVSTSSSASFSTMASNIRKIKSIISPSSLSPRSVTLSSEDLPYTLPSSTCLIGGVPYRVSSSKNNVYTLVKFGNSWFQIYSTNLGALSSNRVTDQGLSTHGVWVDVDVSGASPVITSIDSTGDEKIFYLTS